MIETLQAYLISFAQIVPLEIFAFLGSVIEEIVAPIPSPFVMTSAGTLIAAQNRNIVMIFWIAGVASVGKVIGQLFFYVLADKAEDLVLNKVGRYIGFSHKEVESIGKHFNGTKTDDIMLAVLRAIPIMPSTPISLVAGFIKLNMRTYIVSSFIGNFVRSLTFLYIGYEGLTALTHGIDSLESIMKIGLLMVLGVAVVIIYYKRGKGGFNDFLKKKLKI